MSDILLEIKGLSAKVGEKDILKNVNLVIKKGETHVIMGPNGSGKSTLVNTIMSNPKYEITSSLKEKMLQKWQLTKGQEGVSLCHSSHQ